MIADSLLKFLPIIHLLGIFENILESVDEGNKVAEVACSVVKNKVNRHFVAYNDDVVAVFILLNNGLFVDCADACNKNLRRND